MTLTIRRYERKPDFSPDYDKENFTFIRGASAFDCMERLQEMKSHNDISKYTPCEIVWIID